MTDVQWYTDGDVQFAIVGRYIAVVQKWRSRFADPDDPEKWDASHLIIRCRLDTNELELVQDGGAICASEAEAKETALDVAGYYTRQHRSGIGNEAWPGNPGEGD